tara:strand:+ start:6891 stop:7223 length:333 start_codon:yes stop_codon:yes gene_type:complete
VKNFNPSYVISVLFFFLGLGLSPLSFADFGEDETVRAALEAEFISVDTIGEIFYQERQRNQGCDILANVWLVGDLGSGETAYECDLCLLEADNGFFDFDRDTIFCARERH